MELGKTVGAGTGEAAGHEAGSGMYPVYSMANHSCAASAMATVGGSDGGYELQLRAQVPIRKVPKSPSCPIFIF